MTSKAKHCEGMMSWEGGWDPLWGPVKALLSGSWQLQQLKSNGFTAQADPWLQLHPERGKADAELRQNP